MASAGVAVAVLLELARIRLHRRPRYVPEIAEPAIGDNLSQPVDASGHIVL
ncbi:MAG: hypothetical protein ACYS30_23175 [Planctomycetota bacterium]